MDPRTYYFEAAFTIQKDMTEEYHEDKIQIRNSVKQILVTFKQDQKKHINVLGLYGSTDTVYDYVTKRYNIFLQLDIELSHHKKSCIGLINMESVLIFCFLIPDTKKSEQALEQVEISLLRILIDICQDIILLPSEKTLQKWVASKEISNSINNKMQNYQSEDIDSNKCSVSEITQKLMLDQNQNWKLYYKNSLNSIILYQINQEEYGKLIESYYHEQVKNVMLYGRFNDEILFPNPTFEKNYVLKINKDVLQTMNHYFTQFKDTLENGLYNQLQLKFSPQEFNFLKLAKFFLNHAFRKINSFKENSEVLKGPELIKEVRTSTFRLKSKELLSKLIRIVIKYINKEFSKMQDFVTRKIKNIMEKIEIENGVGQEFTLEMKLLRFKTFRYMDNQFKHVELMERFIQIAKERENKFYQDNLHNYQFIDFFPISTSNENKLNYYLLIMKCQSVESKQAYYYQVYFVQESRKPIMIVTYTELVSPYFYFVIETQSLFQFNLPKRIVISTINTDKECIDTERVIELDDEIYIISYSYSEEYECFLLLSDDKKLYKWNQNDEFFKQQKQSFQEEEGFVIEQDFDSDYIKLMICGLGKYYALFKNQQVDIFDFNNTKITEIKFKNIYISEQIFLFNDSYDSFILLSKNEDQQELYQLVNFNKKSRLTGKTNHVISTSNYFLDLIKQTYVVFGKNSYFLGLTKLQSNFYCEEFCFNKMQDYFLSIKLQKYCNLICQEDFEINQIEIQKLINVLTSRVPIQLCTFECKRLIVLSEGLNKLNQTFDCIQIDQQLKQISFGIIEDHLINTQKPIYVVSILGKQSGGKSYLLNQIFGVRFGVSSARCTDGIWCSQIELDECQFIILDCEGLFGQRRNYVEEITFLSYLTAISDLTIFNQQASYDRHLTELFDNLVEANSRLKGDQLFKGKLMILVRDIYQDSIENAQKELDGQLDSLLNSKNNELMKLLLKNGIQAQLMSYFELEQFEKDIIQIREQILDNAKNIIRWQDAQSLFTAMKITLLQLSVKDTRNVQDYELSYQIHKLKELCNNYWYELPQWIIKKDDNNNISQNIQLQENMEQNFDIILQQALNFVEQNNQNENLCFLQKYNKIDKLIQQFTNKRIHYIMTIIQKELDCKLVQKYQLDKEMKQNILLDCENELKLHQHNYKLCGQTCSKCYSLCTQYNGHLSKNGTKLEKARQTIQKKKSKLQMLQKQLDLENINDLNKQLINEKDILQDLQKTQQKIKGDRIMIQRLQALKDIQQQIYLIESKIKKIINMIQLQDNINKEQEYIQQFNTQHICWSDTHQCNYKDCELLLTHIGEHYIKNQSNIDQCDIQCKLCQNQCILKKGHQNNLLHYCQQKHVCQETCEYCAEQCTQDPFIQHKHICNLRFCNKQCSLGCQRKCSEQHSHELENEHFCNCYHQCDKLCNLPGICTVDGYVKRVKLWKSNAGSLYGQTTYEQVRRKEKCFKLIPIGQNSHDLGHSCSNRKHLCDQQCPGCKAYCYLESGHTNLHHTIYHNIIEQQQSCFILDDKNNINIQYCRPETCDEYCLRLGRSHSHNIECRDQFLCYENQLNKGQKYIKALHINKDIDTILCKQFWEIYGWEQPIRGIKRIEISRCNYKCQQCNKYCNYMAWHDKGGINLNHKFDCIDQHSIKQIDIVFIIDQTDQYNIQIALNILEILQFPKLKFPLNKTKFAIILYSDHHPHKPINSPTEIKQDFIDIQICYNKLKEVQAKKQKIISDYPNAVLDGLNAQLKLSWSSKQSNKFIILLTQAPPHGQSKYHSFEDNYPKGCPCNLKEMDVLKLYYNKQINLIIPELSSHLNLMIKIFQNYLPNLHSINTNKSMPEAIIKYITKILQIQMDTIK